MDIERMQEIEKRANSILESVNYIDNKDSIDVVEVAKKLGFVVGNAGLEDDIDGFIIVEEGKPHILNINTDKLIGVNALKELPWKRFIVAHEIGHYVLHYDRLKDNGMFAHREHRKGKSEKENEADFFAANLLMPRKKFMDKYNELQEKGLSLDDMILLMADKFLVTQPMARRRFEELGIIE